jgi:hypothetical protein
MESKGDPQVVTQKTDSAPWSKQAPFLEKGFGKAEELFNDPQEYFPGQSFVPPSAQTEASIQGMEDAALAPQDLINAGQQQFKDTLGGKFTGQGNPAFDAMAERAIQPLRREFENTVKPNIQGAFSLAGRGGSNMQSAFKEQSANQDYLRAVGDVGASLEYPNYAAERGYQQAAMPQAGAMQQLDYSAPAALGAVGAAREGITGQALGDQMARFNFEQQEPINRLAGYMGMIGGGYGGQSNSQSTQPQTYSNPALGLLGGGLMGASAGNMMGYPGMGALGGGLLGALGSF